MHEPEGRGADRRMARDAVVLAVLLAALFSLLAFLGSETGWRVLASRSRAIDLTVGAGGPVRFEEGSMIAHHPTRRRFGVRLKPLMVEQGGRYLLVADIGPGRALTLEGTEEASDRRFHQLFAARSSRQAQQRLVSLNAAPAKLRLALVVRGDDPITVHELALLPVWRGRGPLLTSLRLIALALLVAFVARHRERLKLGLANPTDADDAIFAAAVFGFCLLAFYSAPVNQLMDGRYVTAVSYSILHEGSLALPEVVDWSDQPEHYRLRRTGGRVFHYAYSSVALLNVPFVWLYELFGISPVTEGGRFDSRAELRILKVTAAMLAAALCVVLYLLARLRLRPRAALFLVGAFAFGSQIFSTLSRPYWSHTWAVLLSAGAILLALAPRWRDSRWAMAAVALLSMAACAVRPVMGISLLALVALLMRAPRPAHLRLFVGILVAAAIAGGGIAIVGWEQVLSDYVAQFRLHRILEMPFSRLWQGAAGSLVSPARGLLLYVPLLAWVFWVLLRDRKALSASTTVRVAMLAIGVHWFLLVVLRIWSDGRVFGPRLFSDSMVWFFLLAVVVLERHEVAGRVVLPPLRGTAFVVCLGLSLFINGRGALAKETWTWGWLDRLPRWAIRHEMPPLRPAYVWNWRNPQFLAGLLPEETADEETEAFLRDWMSGNVRTRRIDREGLPDRD